MTPEEMVSRLLYRDALMLVIDKPAGFAVHRGPKGGESLEDHFDALRFGLPRAPALAHRLEGKDWGLQNGEGEGGVGKCSRHRRGDDVDFGVAILGCHLNGNGKQLS